MCELLSNVYFITINFWWLFPAAMQPRILERVFDASGVLDMKSVDEKY